MYYKMAKVYLWTLEVVGNSVLIQTWFIHGNALDFFAMSSDFIIFSCLSHTLMRYIYIYKFVTIYIYVYSFVYMHSILVSFNCQFNTD